VPPRDPNTELIRQSYTYDAFVSYSYRGQGRFWVGKHFISELEEAAYHTGFGRTLRLAVAADFMHSGARWGDEIKQAISTSACLIAVVSVAYADSDMCQWEWDCFAQMRRPGASNYRQPILTYGRTSDFDPPLEDLRELEPANYHGWWHDVDDIRKQDYFGPFQDAVRLLAGDLYRLVGRVPPQPPMGWPTKAPMPDPRPEVPETPRPVRGAREIP